MKRGEDKGGFTTLAGRCIVVGSRGLSLAATRWTRVTTCLTLSITNLLTTVDAVHRHFPGENVLFPGIGVTHQEYVSDFRKRPSAPVHGGLIQRRRQMKRRR